MLIDCVVLETLEHSASPLFWKFKKLPYIKMGHFKALVTNVLK